MSKNEEYKAKAKAIADIQLIVLSFIEDEKEQGKVERLLEEMVQKTAELATEASIEAATTALVLKIKEAAEAGIKLDD